ncbi:hypothetical protein [Nocardia asteroides]|uniref:hypothetical protein n=1 Tax=Nocardia asteroides TaxID=1824 RepID=UPI001E639C3A|nr:hypothetical protein [Nocardia asteroides]UGT58866.1 hypothetical protein LTT85_33480 [Nocardia asteroides]
MWWRGEETEKWTRSLADWLAPVRATGLTSSQTTALITAHTLEWARSKRWKPATEVPALIERSSANGRTYRGRLDVVCERSWWRPPIAIEIDRANKRWSLDKLIAEADAGHVALWVRWHGDTVIEVPPRVGLVDIRDSIDNPRATRQRVR